MQAPEKQDVPQPEYKDPVREALELKIRDLEAANRELDNFACAVSHDLRAPLRFISKFADLLVTEHGEGMPPQALNYAEMIQVATKQMAQLVDDLLLFSRALRGELLKREVDLAKIFEEVYAGMQDECAGRNLRLEVEELGVVQADPNLLRQVVVNLLDNAIKFTRPREAGVIRVRALEKHPVPVYCLEDNGVGFPEEQEDHIFTVFGRCHQPEDFEGTGVGLALVKQIIERHGGRIWAEGRPGEGAALYFTLASGVSPGVQAVLAAIKEKSDAPD